jgi:hypothetical protein
MLRKDRDCDHDTSLGPLEVMTVDEIKRVRSAESEKKRDEFVVELVVVRVVTVGWKENDVEGTVRCTC